MKNNVLLLALLASCVLAQAMAPYGFYPEEESLIAAAEENESLSGLSEETRGLAMLRSLESLIPTNPDCVRLEKLLRQGVTSESINFRFEMCLGRGYALYDFDRWEPALKLLHRYGADPNARSVYAESEGNTILLYMLDKPVRGQDYPNRFTKKVIEFLIKAGVRVDRANDKREHALDLVLNPSEHKKMLPVCTRRWHYFCFKGIAKKILYEANRIEELEFLDNHRLPEEELEARRYIDDALCGTFCTNITAIICDYAAAKQLKIQEFDSGKGKKRKHSDGDSDGDSDVVRGHERKCRKITDYCAIL